MDPGSSTDQGAETNDVKNEETPVSEDAGQVQSSSASMETETESTIPSKRPRSEDHQARRGRVRKALQQRKTINEKFFGRTRSLAEKQIEPSSASLPGPSSSRVSTLPGSTPASGSSVLADPKVQPWADEDEWSFDEPVQKWLLQGYEDKSQQPGETQPGENHTSQHPDTQITSQGSEVSVKLEDMSEKARGKQRAR